MSEKWVINASPLIVLAKVDSLHLLRQLASEALVPKAVLDEINAGPDDDPARTQLAISPLPVMTIAPHPEVLAWDLGAGETAVLSHAMNDTGWRVVLDDGAARRCARAFSIPVIGTLGIVLRAHKAGLIPSAKSLLKEIQKHGFRLDEQLISQVLKKEGGEMWN